MSEVVEYIFSDRSKKSGSFREDYKFYGNVLTIANH